ncbi:MAG: hypothetical protein KQH83_10675 [Actinobacteria bacterium]|nr:hypothetical protein [Actinomycetota bacterium]
MRRIFTILLGMTLLAAACGDDDSGSTTTGPEAGTATTGATTTTTVPEDVGPPCRLWYTDYSTGTVTSYDLCSAECLGTTRVGASADYVDIAFGAVWVTDCSNEQLVRVDVETNEVTGRLNVPGCPSAMVLAQDAIWLALPSLPGVWEIDPATGEVLSEIVTDEPPLSMQIGSLWLGFMDHLAWTPDEVHAVGSTFFSDLGPRSYPTAGPVKNIDGDPLFTELVEGAGTEGAGTRISGIDGSGTVTVLADLAFFYKGVVGYGSHFLAIAPMDGHAYVGTTDGAPGVQIPVSHPYAAKKGRDGGGGGNGNPPGRRPPNVPQPPDEPGAPVVVVTNACDVFFWPDGSYDALDAQGNCQCDWGPHTSLTDMTAATPDRVAAEIAYAATYDTGAFPMDAPEPSAGPGPAAGGPTCTSYGWSSGDGGRMLSDIYSVWEDEGAPVEGLQVALYLQFGVWYHQVTSGLTGDDGRVDFPEGADLDQIEGAPAAGSDVTIGQAPVVDGTVQLDRACAGTTG